MQQQNAPPPVGRPGTRLNRWGVFGPGTVVAVALLSAGGGEALADRPSSETLSAGVAGIETPFEPRQGAFGTGLCADRSGAVQEVDDLAAALRAFVVDEDRLEPAARQLAIEVVGELSALPVAQKQQICSDLDAAGVGARTIEEINQAIAREAGRSRAPSGCIGLETYRAILGVETVFLSLAQAAQGLCDATACYDPFDTPGLCAVFCVPPPVLNGAAEIIATRRDISDKCADETHEDLMDAARADGGLFFARLSASVNAARLAAVLASDNGASDEDLQDVGDEVEDRFDGTGGRAASNGIGPDLDALTVALASSAQQQRDFEREAIETRIEAAIIQALPVSRLQLPASQGGLLERVRETVAGRIQSAAQVGLPVEGALQAFRQADRAFNEARFKDAYAAYIQSYGAIGALRSRQAVDRGGER